ncbi:MAG: homocysteine methyltransferase [Chloroflexi bacterium]|nr:homocysteine methyltransferase [Chloroflexota bacterium]
MPKGILERLADGVVLGDGGYLLELEKRGYVRAGPFTPEAVLEHPSALIELHREFLNAGAEVLQALTFYASEDKLATAGLAGKGDDINRQAVRLARQVANEGDALVAGNLCLTWAYDPTDPSSPARTRKLLERQVQVQMEEGVDFFIGETFVWLGEALIALQVAQESGLPAMITMGFETVPVAREGDSPAECARKLEAAGAEIVGINCLRNPEYTLPLMVEVRNAVACYTACQPVAYRTPAEQPNFTALPEFPTGLTPLQLSRQAFGDFALKARDLGINYIGSCCGSVAEHVREMARVLGKLPEDTRQWRVDYGKPMSAYEIHRHGLESKA